MNKKPQKSEMRLKNGIYEVFDGEQWIPMDGFKKIEKLDNKTARVRGHSDVYDSSKLEVIEKINEVIERLNKLP